MKKIQGIFLVVGIVIFGIAASAYIETLQYSDWQRTQAILRSVSLQNASSPTVAGASDWGGNIGKVSYIYQVDGKEYKGSRIMPLQNVYLPREKVVNLREGVITVAYNPSEPSQSFIFAITPVTQLIMLLLAGIISFVAALVLPKLVSLFPGATREST